MFDAMSFYELISEHYDDDEKAQLFPFFDALTFKVNRCLYHFDNIKMIVENATDLDNESYYSDVFLPIYYEMEGLLVSMRSSVDMALHLTNSVFDFQIPTTDITLASVYHHKQLPKIVKNVFDRYTRPYQNPTWNFIYTSRNEIVHEKSIHQVLPIRVEFFLAEQPLVFFSYEGTEKELNTHFSNCLRFLKAFLGKLLSSIVVASKH